MRKIVFGVWLIRRWFLSYTILTFITIILGTHVFAQDFPTQPITIVVGSAAGGITDMATRTLANEAKKFLGVEILVTNKIGAMHTVAMSYVISKPLDGYTLGSSTDAPYTKAPHTMTLTFDPKKDTVPIIAYGAFHSLIIARGDSPFKTFGDAINFAKENPGKLTYGHIGVSSNHYMNMAALALHMGLKVSMVPFNGDSEIILSLLGGHIMTGYAGISSCVSHIKAEKLKVLALPEGKERSDKFPQVPTLYELGFKDATPSPYLVIWGPKGLPGPIMRKLEDAFIKASESAEFKKFALDNEVSPIKKGQQAITGLELENFLANTSDICGSLFSRLGTGKTKP